MLPPLLQKINVKKIFRADAPTAKLKKVASAIPKKTADGVTAAKATPKRAPVAASTSKNIDDNVNISTPATTLSDSDRTPVIAAHVDEVELRKTPQPVVKTMAKKAATSPLKTPLSGNQLPFSAGPVAKPKNPAVNKFPLKTPAQSPAKVGSSVAELVRKAESASKKATVRKVQPRVKVGPTPAIPKAVSAKTPPKLAPPPQTHTLKSPSPVLITPAAAPPADAPHDPSVVVPTVEDQSSDQSPGVEPSPDIGEIEETKQTNNSLEEVDTAGVPEGDSVHTNTDKAVSENDDSGQSLKQGEPQSVQGPPVIADPVIAELVPTTTVERHEADQFSAATDPANRILSSQTAVNLEEKVEPSAHDVVDVGVGSRVDLAATVSVVPVDAAEDLVDVPPTSAPVEECPDKDSKHTERAQHGSESIDVNDNSITPGQTMRSPMTPQVQLADSPLETDELAPSGMPQTVMSDDKDEKLASVELSLPVTDASANQASESTELRALPIEVSRPLEASDTTVKDSQATPPLPSSVVAIDAPASPESSVVSVKFPLQPSPSVRDSTVTLIEAKTTTPPPLELEAAPSKDNAQTTAQPLTSASEIQHPDLLETTAKVAPSETPQHVTNMLQPERKPHSESLEVATSTPELEEVGHAETVVLTGNSPKIDESSSMVITSFDKGDEQIAVAISSADAPQTTMSAPQSATIPRETPNDASTAEAIPPYEFAESELAKVALSNMEENKRYDKRASSIIDSEESADSGESRDADIADVAASGPTDACKTEEVRASYTSTEKLTSSQLLECQIELTNSSLEQSEAIDLSSPSAEPALATDTVKIEISVAKAQRSAGEGTGDYTLVAGLQTSESVIDHTREVSTPSQVTYTTSPDDVGCTEEQTDAKQSESVQAAKLSVGGGHVSLTPDLDSVLSTLTAGKQEITSAQVDHCITSTESRDVSLTRSNHGLLEPIGEALEDLSNDLATDANKKSSEVNYEEPRPQRHDDSKVFSRESSRPNSTQGSADQDLMAFAQGSSIDFQNLSNAYRQMASKMSGAGAISQIQSGSEFDSMNLPRTGTSGSNVSLRPSNASLEDPMSRASDLLPTDPREPISTDMPMILNAENVDTEQTADLVDAETHASQNEITTPHQAESEISKAQKAESMLGGEDKFSRLEVCSEISRVEQLDLSATAKDDQSKQMDLNETDLIIQSPDPSYHHTDSTSLRQSVQLRETDIDEFAYLQLPKRKAVSASMASLRAQTTTSQDGLTWLNDTDDHAVAVVINVARRSLMNFATPLTRIRSDHGLLPAERPSPEETPSPSADYPAVEVSSVLKIRPLPLETTIDRIVTQRTAGTSRGATSDGYISVNSPTILQTLGSLPPLSGPTTPDRPTVTSPIISVTRDQPTSSVYVSAPELSGVIEAATSAVVIEAAPHSASTYRESATAQVAPTRTLVTSQFAFAPNTSVSTNIPSDSTPWITVEELKSQLRSQPDFQVSHATRQVEIKYTEPTRSNTVSQSAVRESGSETERTTVRRPITQVVYTQTFSNDRGDAQIRPAQVQIQEQQLSAASQEGPAPCSRTSSITSPPRVITTCASEIVPVHSTSMLSRPSDMEDSVIQKSRSGSISTCGMSTYRKLNAAEIFRSTQPFKRELTISPLYLYWKRTQQALLRAA